MTTSDGRRVVVVTGASAGLGRATVQLLAEQGNAVALLARGEAGLQAALADVESVGGVGLAIPTDMADNDAVENAAARIEAELGEIDVWINVAFSSVFAEFLDISPEEFERTTHVTYMGFVNGTRAALKRMRARDRGVIVQTGSALSRRGIPLQSAYCGSKHAINGFTEAIRTELLHDHSNVRVSIVQMPALNTPQFDWVLSRLPKNSQPVPPIFQPEVGARALVHAVDHYRREWWVGAPTVGTIIANQVVPGLIDRYLARTGFKSQQTDVPTAADRPSNLFVPVDQDEPWGAHGSFDTRATGHSLQWEASKHRRSLWAGAVAATAAAFTLWRR